MKVTHYYTNTQLRLPAMPQRYRNNQRTEISSCHISFSTGQFRWIVRNPPTSSRFLSIPAIWAMPVDIMHACMYIYMYICNHLTTGYKSKQQVTITGYSNSNNINNNININNNKPLPTMPTILVPEEEIIDLAM